MNVRYVFSIRIALLTSLSIVCTYSSPSLAEPTINKKQVNAYLQRNKAGTVAYQCKLPKSNCSVICSSGGNDYIDEKGVTRAFHGERKSSVNGAVTGYYLVVDVDESEGNQDIWAVLQLESSCLFRGMTPVL